MKSGFATVGFDEILKPEDAGWCWKGSPVHGYYYPNISEYSSTSTSASTANCTMSSQDVPEGSNTTCNQRLDK
ncbi:unnamed protein product [Urochloa humidicola]